MTYYFESLKVAIYIYRPDVSETLNMSPEVVEIFQRTLVVVHQWLQFVCRIVSAASLNTCKFYRESVGNHEINQTN